MRVERALPIFRTLEIAAHLAQACEDSVKDAGAVAKLLRLAAVKELLLFQVEADPDCVGCDGPPRIRIRTDLAERLRAGQQAGKKEDRYQAQTRLVAHDSHSMSSGSSLRVCSWSQSSVLPQPGCTVFRAVAVEQMKELPKPEIDCQVVIDGDRFAIEGRRPENSTCEGP